MTRGFHGRTLGALSATHNPKYRKSFEPLVPHFIHVSFGNMEVLEDKISDNTAAVILEPVLGEGGVIPSPPGYLESIRELCNTRGSLMILDEIQTGFGRTGAMFAYEKYGVVPDIICLAKSIAGGLPMGAVVATEKASNIPKNAHGSTGLKNLDSPIIRESRGFGLMLGLELKKRSAPYLQALIKEGVLALPAGKNVIRFLPPLVIDKAQIDIVLDKLEQVIRNG
jgi:acetylornithine/LysW-gamma-L-lysine aminotransferase